jgi:hypothetical protein
MEIKTMNMLIFIKITFEKHSYYRCLRIRNLIFKRVRIYYKKKLNVLQILIDPQQNIPDQNPEDI